MRDEALTSAGAFAKEDTATSASSSSSESRIDRSCCSRRSRCAASSCRCWDPALFRCPSAGVGSELSELSESELAMISHVVMLPLLPLLAFNPLVAWDATSLPLALLSLLLRLALGLGLGTRLKVAAFVDARFLFDDWTRWPAGGFWEWNQSVAASSWSPLTAWSDDILMRRRRTMSLGSMPSSRKNIPKPRVGRPSGLFLLRGVHGWQSHKQRMNTTTKQ